MSLSGARAAASLASILVGRDTTMKSAPKRVVKEEQRTRSGYVIDSEPRIDSRKWSAIRARTKGVGRALKVVGRSFYNFTRLRAIALGAQKLSQREDRTSLSILG
jgi:hypothetical protein